MLTFDEARRTILTNVPRVAAEQVSLWAAEQRVLAEDLIAYNPLPAHDYSALDGYALSAKGLGTEPGETVTLRLPVRGESRAGGTPGTLEPGTAQRIFTGAPLPTGADAVIAQESVTLSSGALSATLRISSGQNVRRRGEDLTPGQLALERGSLLGPGQLALAAGLDQNALKVAQRPRVTILCTGDELREPGSQVREGTIPETNGVALAALARRANALVWLAPLLGDNLGAIERAVAHGLAASDLVVTVGGASVGDYDLVRRGLEQAGVELDFFGVRIKPGKPVIFGRAGNKRVLGLPGNPVSAQVTFGLFGLPLLRALQGQTRLLPDLHRLELGRAVSQTPGRLGFHRARFENGRAFPLDNQASGAVTGLSGADLLLLLPEDCARLEAGTAVDALFLAAL